MRYSILFTSLAATTVSGHGLIRTCEGANGVTMPGLTGKSSALLNSLEKEEVKKRAQDADSENLH